MNITRRRDGHYISKDLDVRIPCKFEKKGLIDDIQYSKYIEMWDWEEIKEIFRERMQFNDDRLLTIANLQSKLSIAMRQFKLDLYSELYAQRIRDAQEKMTYLKELPQIKEDQTEEDNTETMVQSFGRMYLLPKEEN